MTDIKFIVNTKKSISIGKVVNEDGSITITVNDSTSKELHFLGFCYASIGYLSIFKFMEPHIYTREGNIKTLFGIKWGKNNG